MPAPPALGHGGPGGSQLAIDPENESRRVRVFHVDAFTTQAFAGNPAGVVLHAERLREEEMPRIARELHDGDTIFLLPADGPDHDLRARFFTPRGETGFVGHASIAAHAVLASLGLPPCPRQKQRTGIVNFERQADHAGESYAFTQSPPPVPRPLEEPALAALLAALSVRSVELDPRCPAVVAGTGGSRALIAVSDGAMLASLQPDLPRLAGLAAAGAPAGCFLYTLAPAVPDCQTEARMFCPALGIPEDPVSGNAHALLGAYLYGLGLLEAGESGARFIARQGHHMDRPGSLIVTVFAAGGLIQAVQVSGHAIIVFDAVIELPPTP
ncbi:MAG TPA: PhzF family phenazine biosynthesis isomerase [Steroidobacteraceae bacterium]|nr:PhzF family phenazine biosynthesis isomerase [Steroidobacteraceae bacterium]